jgi:nucleoside phosphorylase
VSNPGEVRLQFNRRLGDDWRDLADFLGVPGHQIRSFNRGDEARDLWEWLNVRGRLGELPRALLAVGRADLADLLRQGATVPRTSTGNAREDNRTAVVFTAIGVETLAVLAHLKEFPDHLGEREVSGTLYETGTFAGDKSTWHVSVAEIGPGNAGAAAELERARLAFAPDAVMFVGVAGGLKDVVLGDVVAADAVYGYETGKDTDTGFLPRIKTQSSSHRLVQHARRVARHSQWQRRVKQPTTTSTKAQALVKPIAAGEKVVAGTESRAAEQLRRYCSDAVAVEMEGFGFLEAAYRSRSLEALVVRGVSDLLGQKDRDADAAWQPVAARHAAAFAFTVLDNAGRADDDSVTNPSAGNPSRYNVTVSGSQGVQIGDHNTQHNSWG